MGKADLVLAAIEADSTLSEETRAALRTLVSGGVVVVAAASPAPVAKKPNTFYQNVIKGRVPCAYGSESCKGIKFAPNGVGSREHTTCDEGRKALAAAQATRKSK